LRFPTGRYISLVATRCHRCTRPPWSTPTAHETALMNPLLRSSSCRVVHPHQHQRAATPTVYKQRRTNSSALFHAAGHPFTKRRLVTRKLHLICPLSFLATVSIFLFHVSFCAVAMLQPVTELANIAQRALAGTFMPEHDRCLQVARLGRSMLAWPTHLLDALATGQRWTATNTRCLTRRLGRRLDRWTPPPLRARAPSPRQSMNDTRYKLCVEQSMTCCILVIHACSCALKIRAALTHAL
jgi:hypothetical protein